MLPYSDLNRLNFVWRTSGQIWIFDLCIIDVGGCRYESPWRSSRSLAIQEEPPTVKETDAERGPERDEEQEKQGYSGASGPKSTYK